MDSGPVKCVICCENATNDTRPIIKDVPFQQLLGLLWDSLHLDIKFTENAKFDLCMKCFDVVLKLSDYNDSCVILERHKAKLVCELSNTTWMGIKELKMKNKPLVDPHQKFEEKYKNGPPEEDSSSPGYKYNLETSCEAESSSAQSGKNFIVTFNNAVKVEKPKESPPRSTYNPRRGKRKKYYHTDEDEDSDF